jgi:DNA polymerase-3 subunit delta'
MVQIGRNQDPRSALEHYIQPSDRVLPVAEHKKEKGVSVGIFIEDVRAIQEMVRTSSPKSRTVVALYDAAKMTSQAQNALLKLLEEPRNNLHFILLSTHPQRLLPTVRSRCQFVQMPSVIQIELPSDKKAKILFMADGSESEVERLSKDPEYYAQQERRFGAAKRLLSAHAAEQLAAVAEVKESREHALELLHAALVVVRFMLVRKPTKELHARAKKILQAEKSLQQNGNVRLWLLACVL